MKYAVWVRDTSWSFVEVEAESKEEAEDKANQMYLSGEINPEDGEVAYTVEEIPNDR